MRRLLFMSSVVVTGCVLTFAFSPPGPPLQNDAGGRAGAAQETGRDALDVAAIMQSAKHFTDAYNRGDAKAVAALWTENGECRDDDGRTLIGREAIEREYAELFKQRKRGKIEALVKSVRFPARDLAVEEGLLRQSHGASELPASTTYEAVHVREGGKWKIALSSEGGAGLDRLDDLDWLLGEWRTKIKDDVVVLSFARDASRPVVTATFTRTPPGKTPLSGSIRIAVDPETGRIRSWGFEEDGAHSQSLWHNDGKSWVLDQAGVLADGTPTAERILLQRVSNDVITWRAIDRLVGDTLLADTPPMRLTRKPASR
jgi:uncharacterized protein (TIGR02246 family)